MRLIHLCRVSRGENGAFQVGLYLLLSDIFVLNSNLCNFIMKRLERGELDLYAFYDLFGKELSDPRNLEYYKEYRLLKKG